MKPREGAGFRKKRRSKIRRAPARFRGRTRARSASASFGSARPAASTRTRRETFQGNSSAYQPAVQPPREWPTKSNFSSARARASASIAATRPRRPKPAGARGAAPVGRVGSEAVEEDDGPLRRERSEDERRKGGSVVRGKDLPPRARKEKAFLLNRPVDGEWIDGERAEEKGDEEGERGENPGQERNPPAHRPGTNTRRATAGPRGCPRFAEAWRSPAAERNRRMRPSRRRASRARRATGRARPRRARRSRPRSRASASPRARRGGGSSASRFRRSPRSRTARASAGR